MATRQRKQAPARQERPARKQYEETPDWGTVFQRTENRPPQPGFTGEGVLSDDSLQEISEAGGEFRISIWTLDRDGKPLKNRNGSRRFRVHIEPPYEGDDQGDDEPAAASSDEDIPF